MLDSRQADGFEEMKDLFVRAAEHLDHGKGAWLRAQVRAAGTLAGLWSLRCALLAALRADDRRTRALRAELYRSLDNVFPALSQPAFELDQLPPLPASWHGGRRGAMNPRFEARAPR